MHKSLVVQPSSITLAERIENIIETVQPSKIILVESVFKICFWQGKFVNVWCWKLVFEIVVAQAMSDNNKIKP